MENKDILKKVAKEFNVSEADVERIINNDFKTMVTLTREFDENRPETHHVFLLPNFCKFVINVKRAKKMQNHRKIKDESI